MDMSSLLWGNCKSWAVDSGMDSRLDCGLDCGLDSGMDSGMDSGKDSGMDLIVDWTRRLKFGLAAVAQFHI